MTFVTTLRQSGGSIILAIPKTIARTMAVEAGSIVELEVEGRKLSVTPARRGLAERLAASPQTPSPWRRDDKHLHNRPKGRELL